MRISRTFLQSGCDQCYSAPHLPGCPNRRPKQIGLCEQCDERLYDDDRVWTDADGNLFCSEECAKDYHKIKEIEE